MAVVGPLRSLIQTVRHYITFSFFLFFFSFFSFLSFLSFFPICCNLFLALKNGERGLYANNFVVRARNFFFFFRRRTELGN